MPIQSEVRLLNSGLLIRRGEFGPLRGLRCYQVEDECFSLGITPPQALSIRKQLMVKKALKNSCKLKSEKRLDNIIKSFQCQQKSLLEMAKSLDLPPVSIFRAILASRVLKTYPKLSNLNRRRPAGRIIQSIINESDPHNVNEFLSEWELQELRTAKEHDIVGYAETDSTPMEWEKAIYRYLDHHGINYVTEDTLKQAEIKCTPDCLILDDLCINEQKIQWIEVKSFYASGLRDNWFFTSKALAKQVERYRAEFGDSGAVILKNGFSRIISGKYPDTLFLDSGPIYLDSDLEKIC